MEIQQTGKLHLIWIAIDRYKNRLWPSLNNAVSGSEALEEALQDGFGLTSTQTVSLKNRLATLAQIEKTLRSFAPGGANALSEEDQLIISFAGHGERDPLTEETAFMPFDGDPESTSTWLRFNHLAPILSVIEARHILVISDSCFSGGVFRGAPLPRQAGLSEAAFAQRVFKRDSRQMIASGGVERTKDGGGRHGNSVFLEGLVHSLKASDDEWLLADELFKDTRNYVVANAEQTPEFGPLGQSGHGGGQMVFFRSTQKDTEIEKKSRAFGVDSDQSSVVVTAQAQPSIVSEQDKKPRIQFKTLLITLIVFVAFIVGSVLWYVSNEFWPINAASENVRQGNSVAPENLAEATTPEDSVLVARCDSLAGSVRFSTEASTTIVKYADIDYATAIPACRAAYVQFPDNERTSYQFARALARKGDVEGIDAPLEEANAIARSSCEGGNPSGCYFLGITYRDGEGTNQDYPLSLKIFEKSCELGDPDGCTEAGLFYDNYKRNDGIDDDYSIANVLFARGCELARQGLGGSACDNLGLNYEFGIGLTESAVDAASFYQKGCDLGHQRSCAHFADLLIKGKGVEEDFSRANELFLSACSSNDKWACGELGNYFRLGAFGTKDYVKAASFLNESCDLGEGRACGRLGDLYEDGDLGEPNAAIAADFFVKGCDTGNGWSCGRLADLYYDGDLGTPDYVVAEKHFVEGCENGSGWSCERAASIYLEGKLGNKDTDKGVSFLERACDLDESGSCSRIGDIILASEGNATPEDLVRAQALFTKDCEAHSNWSCTRLGNLHLSGDLGKVDYKAARSAFELGCNGPVSASCIDLVKLLLNPDFESSDPVLADEILLSSCKDGDAWICAASGDNLIRGEYPALKADLAVTLYEIGCERGDGYACTRHARLFEEGITVSKDVGAAALLYEKGCELGDNGGCSRYSKLQESGALGAIDYFLAAKIHDNQCENGESYSCYQIGKIYHTYNLGDPNFDKARNYFKKGCELRNAASCIELILEMELNRNEAVSVDEASIFADAACENAGPHVCSGIGWAIAEERLSGGPERAVAFFVKAAHGGSSAPFNSTVSTDQAASEKYKIADNRFKELVKILQGALQQEGVFTGSIDGVPSLQTQQAIRELCGCRLPLDSKL